MYVQVAFGSTIARFKITTEDYLMCSVPVLRYEDGVLATTAHHRHPPPLQLLAGHLYGGVHVLLVSCNDFNTGPMRQAKKS